MSDTFLEDLVSNGVLNEVYCENEIVPEYRASYDGENVDELLAYLTSVIDNFVVFLYEEGYEIVESVD